MRIKDEVTKVNKARGRIRIRNLGDETSNAYYLDGDVCTKYGFVSVMSYKATFKETSILQFISNGKLYDRRIEKAYKPTYLVTLANRFVEEIKNLERLEY